jgi:bifunctional DNase/RNase
MSRSVRIGMAGTLLVLLAMISVSKETAPGFVEMEVRGVKLDPYGQNPVVVLVDKEEKKALPIWIGLLEASAIERELNQVSTPRPMTHDLFHSVLGHVDVKVKEVRIISLIDKTYHATLFLTKGEDVIEVDARPSDSIILALKSKAPISVATKILEEQGITLALKDRFGEGFGIRVQELTPSLALQFNFRGQGGVLVAEVLPGSAAEASGVRSGDIITKIHLKEVGSVREFEEAIDATKEIDSIQLSIFRDDQFSEVTLQKKP